MQHFRRVFLILSFVCFLSFSAHAQNDSPKLVVGIVVDQMKQEYIYRFYDHFGEGGFKRFVEEGYMMKNGHFNYAPTFTGPGHASVYSGTPPGVHGVIGNNFYDRINKEKVYCAGDPSMKTIGSDSDEGEMSPHRMLTTTISDELRIFYQKKSKTIGIALKDRGSILPAGHMANAAYWYDYSTGRFISSSFYLDELPAWVKAYNGKKRSDHFLKQTWNTLKPIETYVESGPDNSPYERRLGGPERPATFPYDLKELRKNKSDYALLTSTPFGDVLTIEMAREAVKNESLGKDDITDLLAISFSSPDIIGHSFGPNSKEVQDTYVRLDKLLADFFKYLDEEVGEKAYTVFLTADHAVAHVPQYMIDEKVPAGLFRMGKNEDELKDFLNEKYGKEEWIENISNLQIFLNRELIREKGHRLTEMQKDIADFVLGIEGVSYAYPAYLIQNSDFNEGGLKGSLIRGYHQKRSGDVLFVLDPAWFEGNWPVGTTHGSGYTYDTHVPILWYGWGVPKGSSVRRASITDIAPTLSMMLGIPLPNGATGEPIFELFD